MIMDNLKFKACMPNIYFLQDVDNYVDLEYLGTTTTMTTPTTPTAHMGADSMVPVHTPEVIDHSSTKVSIETAGPLDVEAASKCNYFYRTTSLNHCVRNFILFVCQVSYCILLNKVLALPSNSRKPYGNQSQSLSPPPWSTF